MKPVHRRCRYYYITGVQENEHVFEQDQFCGDIFVIVKGAFRLFHKTTQKSTPPGSVTMIISFLAAQHSV